MIDGQIHWFGVPGIANGMAVMRDEQTESIWDHMTGECFAGPLTGHRLEVWPVHRTNVLAERTSYSNTILFKSDNRTIKSRVMRRIGRIRFGIIQEDAGPFKQGNGSNVMGAREQEATIATHKWSSAFNHALNRLVDRILLPYFRRSISGEIDPRLPKGELGLGVMNDLSSGKFYPMRSIPKGGFIEDEWLGRRLQVKRGAIDGVPSATWLDGDAPPMQLFTRWYGFSFTYPDCSIYRPENG